MKLNEPPASMLGLAEDLDDADERDQRGVLLEADEVVEQRRDHPPDRLRQHHVAQPLERDRPSDRAAASCDGWTASMPAR